MAEKADKSKPQAKTEPASTQAPAPVKEKKGGAMKWVLLLLGGCFLLTCCISSVIGILCVSSADFKDGFTEGYCDELQNEGIDPSEDPFGLCE